MQWISDNPYTCPILMWIQSVLYWQKWEYGSSGWVVLSGKNSRATCKWPVWAVMLECSFWNGPIGGRIRGWIGYDTREYRLKQQQQ